MNTDVLEPCRWREASDWMPAMGMTGFEMLSMP